MKFYYNGNLIRTSKTHHYAYAVMEGNRVFNCSATREGCERFIQSYINESLGGIENCNKAIKALESGRNGYYHKFGRHEYYYKFDKNDTIETFKEHINNCKANIEYRRNNWKIVEIEERA